ncbi:hypothetical protein BATDEDRAFT_92247 [Batrachochytrium dendrobatidis JAM81]|uniref:Meiotic nuclear division protein 1 n=2 Tax=Batrachochytrium dendrobatidis TaxID=109871 RepID=F4PCK1_BATDJ|nr:uncharacterized protein BATDEDRAFT_92247 [Batrachochytrium dendrobatidis JAM81]EGF76958.1 hypothetical protein BATDEDRAFT_92247 [Batrachochytrium dendrobatidis JAM81]OAJ45022.1 hypothetical protein BDEG_28190 [Batrachochytrium dendrobatidis JEL423]|eukprot:XP_006682517.1 hypothetical protein BATDEDRAFT_92247 [Batrachochytrium dendrobatidis JAM81]
MAPRTKPLSLDEKRRRMICIFHESKEFYNLKEIEKIAPRSKGIIEKSVKEVLDGLVADGLVTMEKIGSSNYYWSFPGANSHQIRNRLETAKKELKAIHDQEQHTRLAISNALLVRKDTDERTALSTDLAAAQIRNTELVAKVAQFQDADPEVMRTKEQGIQVAKEAANRWTGI